MKDGISGRPLVDQGPLFWFLTTVRFRLAV
jgi:hypothetical protein